MGLMDWDKHKECFFIDGSLREFFIFDTDISDWQKLLDFLENSQYEIFFRVDREIMGSLESAQFIFEHQLEQSRFLSVTFRNMQLNCHFLSENEIDFNLDPKQVQSELDYFAVIRFMQDVSNLLGKTMVLTLENRSDHILLKIEPT